MKCHKLKVTVAHAAKDLRVETRHMPTRGPGHVLVKMATVGICESDLHYYNHGDFGPIKLREPIILGHEVAGYIEAIGYSV